ncbi:MAG: hypothetical protein UEY91_01745 [Lachnospiraceae bacterium]|nr:hypothetical protein [Lachnospiraceae bacterium]
MKDKKFYQRVVIGIAVGIISVIALVGFMKAPSKSSDKLAENLQQEFKANQKMLKEQDQAKQTSATEGGDADAAKKEKAPTITCVGDSVMLGAAPELMEAIPDGVIDAKESRQARDGIEILEGLKKENKLGSTVVIELGTNCYFSSTTGQEIIDYLGKDTKIYWVTVYGKYLQDQERTNSVIRQLAKDNKNVDVIAWDELAAANSDWFYNDGIHLNGEGRSGYAKMICDALGIEMKDTAGQTEEVGNTQQEAEPSVQ